MQKGKYKEALDLSGTVFDELFDILMDCPTVNAEKSLNAALDTAQQLLDTLKELKEENTNAKA